MSDSTSNLDLLASSQAQKEIVANALFDAMSYAALYGRRGSTTSGLTWGYYGGKALVAGVPTAIANGTLTLGASATNYVEADPSDGTVSSNTSAFTSGFTRLYTVVTDTDSVTSYTDHRVGGAGANGQGVATGGTAGQVLSKIDGTDFNTEWTTVGGGDVDGPASSVNNRVVFFDGTTGKLIKDSGLTLSGSNTGDQTITLTGDVTGSGTGSFSATIANDAVTYAKMQDVSATDKLLGRSTAGAGNVEEIACTAAGRALLDDADAAAQRTTLGLGTAATLASDDDDTMAADSSTSVPTQAAVKGYVDAAVLASGSGDVVGPASAVDSRVVLFDGTTGKLIKSSGLTLAGTNTGDETATTVGALINGAAAKTTPVDADLIGLVDSAASNVLKKLSWANLKATLLATVSVFTKNQSVATVALTDGANIAVDASLSNNFKVTLGGNRTLDNPTNLTEGMVLNFAIDQDGTGGRTIGFGSMYKWPGGIAPTWVTTASAKNFFSAYYDGTILRCSGGAGYA